MKTEIHFRMVHIHIAPTLPDKVNQSIGVNRLYMNNELKARDPQKKMAPSKAARSHSSAQREWSKVIANGGRTAAMQTIRSATYSAGPECLSTLNGLIANQQSRPIR